MTSHTRANEIELSVCEVYARMVARRDDWSDMAERAAVLQWCAGLDQWAAEWRAAQEAMGTPDRGRA